MRTVSFSAEAPEGLPRHRHVLYRDIQVPLEFGTPPDIARPYPRSGGRVPSQPDRHSIRTEGEQGENDDREGKAEAGHRPLVEGHNREWGKEREEAADRTSILKTRGSI